MGVLVKAPGPSRPPWEGMGVAQCGAAGGRRPSFWGSHGRAAVRCGVQGTGWLLAGRWRGSSSSWGACPLALGAPPLGPVLRAARGRLGGWGLRDPTEG